MSNGVIHGYSWCDSAGVIISATSTLFLSVDGWPHALAWSRRTGGRHLGGVTVSILQQRGCITIPAGSRRPYCRTDHAADWIPGPKASYGFTRSHPAGLLRSGVPRHFVVCPARRLTLPVVHTGWTRHCFTGATRWFLFASTGGTFLVNDRNLLRVWIWRIRIQPVPRGKCNVMLK